MNSDDYKMHFKQLHSNRKNGEFVTFKFDRVDSSIKNIFKGTFIIELKFKILIQVGNKLLDLLKTDSVFVIALAVTSTIWNSLYSTYSRQVA